MGNITGFVSDGSALVGNITGNITGLGSDRNSERLDDSKNSNHKSGGGFFKDRGGSSNTNKSGQSHQRAKSNDGISAYDADRDRRRVFG
jgi:hypothetical protein